MILFNEFTAWAIKKNLDIDTDDDLLWVHDIYKFKT